LLIPSTSDVGGCNLTIMNFEAPKMSSLKEIAEIEKARTLSDAELLKEGAEYKFDEAGQKSLELTEE